MGLLSGRCGAAAAATSSNDKLFFSLFYDSTMHTKRGRAGLKRKRDGLGGATRAQWK